MLKRFLILCAMAMALALPGVAGAESRVDYFPLASGMAWAYGDSFHVVQVGGMMKSLPPIYITDYMGQKRYFIQQDDGKVLEWRDGKTRLLYDFGAKVGASWKIEPLGDGSEILDGTVVTVASVSEGVSTPYGGFRGCVHLEMRPRDGLADAGITDMWFAPGVGLVKWSEIWIGGVRSFALTRFSGQKDLSPPSPPDSIVVRPAHYANSASEERNGVRYEVATDTSVYRHGDVLSMRYRVTNVDRDSVRFWFGSTQQSELLIVDGDEHKVWAWSSGRGFGDAITGFTLKRGESWSFEWPVKLETELYQKLSLEQVTVPAGKLRVVGYLPVMPREDMKMDWKETEVSVGFEVAGDTTGTQLTGQVYEDSGMLMRPMALPLEGARVDLNFVGELAAPVSGFTVWTDREGRFGFRQLPFSDYILTVSKPGYITDKINVTLKAGENHVSVSLKRETVHEDFPNVNTWAHERTLAELATDREGYAPGDSVLVRYRLVNTTKDTLKLMFRSGQRYNFELHGPQGRVWGWADNKRFTQALGARDLAPGDTITVREAFPMPDVGPGGEGYYSLTGYMTVTPDAPGAVRQEETEVQVKFRIGRTGGVRPPEPPVAHPSDYFPLASGMAWAYGDSFHVVRVTGVMESAPPIYVVDDMGQKRHFIQQDDGKVLEWRDGKRRLLYDFGAKVGASWKIEPLGDGFEILDGTVVTVVDTAEVVTTPYGAFKGCIHLGMKPRAGLADAGFTDMWFAPDVGLVKWSEIWIGGVRSYELTRFSVPERATTEARLRVELTTDREAYAPGDSVFVRYRLTNATRETLKLVFPSGQRYDFILEGPQGKVWQWSDGKAFTAAVGTQSFTPGDSVVVRETFAIPKVDSSGEGTYVLTGFMALPPGAVLFSTPEVVRREETEAKVKFMVGRSGEVKVPPDSSSGTQTVLRKGDFNRDKQVDFSDFFLFAGAFGKQSGTPGFEAAFDLDSDGSVGFSDFFLFIDTFGERR
ncbi:MAG: hypothetical protein EXS64_12935 [Candidatus Latescibacteria bacterium]|nr:hypothetical protein [Candidatus Latescibacterota bacterium]